MGHALRRIIDRYRQMVTGKRILARQHDIALRQRVSVDRPREGIGPHQVGVGSRNRARHVEPPGVRDARRDARGALRLRQRAAGAGIDGFRPMRCRLARRDFRARAEAGIEQPHRAQPRQGRSISLLPRRLEQHRPIPLQPQPGEVRQDRLDMFRPAARAVNILDPQQETPAAGARQIVRQHRRIGVPQMQPPCRTRRKARNHVAHDHPNTALDRESRAVLKSLTTGCGVITASS
ncbi:hypothetical protein D9M73_95260 [compost metagenome]